VKKQIFYYTDGILSPALVNTINPQSIDLAGLITDDVFLIGSPNTNGFSFLTSTKIYEFRIRQKALNSGEVLKSFFNGYQRFDTANYSNARSITDIVRSTISYGIWVPINGTVTTGNATVATGTGTFQPNYMRIGNIVTVTYNATITPSVTITNGEINYDIIGGNHPINSSQTNIIGSGTINSNNGFIGVRLIAYINGSKIQVTTWGSFTVNMGRELYFQLTYPTS
jgi:hypothetical protein